MDRIAFLTGAGISTGAGIPDFRGPQGVWTKDPLAEKMSTLSWYLQDEEVRQKAWQMRIQSGALDAQPTPAHVAIAELEKTGRVAGIITQNTDGLHQLAGSRAELVHEVHGSMRTWQCEDCAATGDIREQLTRVQAGEADPDCPHCGGITRSATILFEEMLKPEVIDAAVHTAENCELMIAIGTGLGVQPVASLFPLAVDSGARGIIVNAEPTPFDDYAAEVLRGDIQDVVPALLHRLSA